METSSAAAVQNKKKRKNIAATAGEDAKRLKTEQEGGAQPLHPPRVSVTLDRLQQPVTLKELTQLLHYAALGKADDVKQPSWCQFHHQGKLHGVNVVIVEGLTQADFYKHYLTMRHLRTRYTTRITFTPSSTHDNIPSEIFSSEVPKSDNPSVPQTPNSELNKGAAQCHPIITKFGTQRKGLTAYVLTQEDMIKTHFPVKGLPRFKEFVCTHTVDCVTDVSPLYGLDCEMCLTQKGNELTRVSLVDTDGNCVMDELVKPQNRIFCYFTKYSGITPAMLRPIRTTLRDVQEKLVALLPSDAVLVGHSLENDLLALKLIHRHVIDTSLLYRRDCGNRFKLKVLAETVLKRKIQTKGKKGHDSTEDALAALDLAKYFIETGPRQVVERHMEELRGHTVVEQPPDCGSAPAPSHRFADVLQRRGQSVAFHGKRADVSLDLSCQHWHRSDKEALDSFRGQTTRSFLSVLQLSSFSKQLKRREPQKEQQHQRVCSNLRDLCVVFAGPLPAGFSEQDTKKLFTCCGPVRKIKMLNTVRLHAEIEFELLEGAMLALQTLNGLNVQGQSIKVQRPVYESALDLDLTIDTLKADVLNHTHLYTVKLKPSAAEDIRISPKFNGCMLDVVNSADTTNGPTPADVNDKWLQLRRATSKLSEEKLRETFDRFGCVERMVLPTRPGKRARHAFIKFTGSEEKHAALSSMEDLWKENYLVCPSLTPPHLSSWSEMATPVTRLDRKHLDMATHQDQVTEALMRKLDHRLEKLFTSLPDNTLSVVLMPGQSSANDCGHGLCFIETKLRPETKLPHVKGKLA